MNDQASRIEYTLRRLARPAILGVIGIVLIAGAFVGINMLERALLGLRSTGSLEIVATVRPEGQIARAGRVLVSELATRLGDGEASLPAAPEARFGRLRGLVLDGDTPVEGAIVTAIYMDALLGQRPIEVVGGPGGRFNSEPFPISDGARGSATTDSRLVVSAVVLDEGDEPVRQGTLHVTFRADGTELKQSIVRTPTLLLLLPAVVFVASIFGAIVMRPSRKKFLFAIASSVLMTGAMIGLTGLALFRVSQMGLRHEVLALGFVWVFRGSYVEGQGQNWIVSLTEPVYPLAGTVQEGFGAPLWVLLIAVMGAGLLTVGLIVKEIASEPTEHELATDERAMRPVVTRMIQHQFYMLFSPLGAVFVYQLLVAGEMAGRQAMVGLTALGAAAVLNVLVKKAVVAATAAVGSVEEQEVRAQLLREVLRDEIRKASARTLDEENGLG